MNKKSDIITDSVPNITHASVPLTSETIVALKSLSGKTNLKDALTVAVRSYVEAGKR